VAWKASSILHPPLWGIEQSASYWLDPRGLEPLTPSVAKSLDQVDCLLILSYCYSYPQNSSDKWRAEKESRKEVGRRCTLHGLHGYKLRGTYLVVPKWCMSVYQLRCVHLAACEISSCWGHHCKQHQKPALLCSIPFLLSYLRTQYFAVFKKTVVLNISLTVLTYSL